MFSESAIQKVTKLYHLHWRRSGSTDEPLDSLPRSPEQTSGRLTWLQVMVRQHQLRICQARVRFHLQLSDPLL